jgi:glycosyltransferase involved in cell wall biosynthesis
VQWDRYYSDYPEPVRNLAYDAFAAPYRVVFVARSTLDAWKPLDSRHSFTLIRNGLNTAEMIAAYRGLDRTEARALVAAQPGDCVFVCVGTVTARKGQHDLVAAYAQLPPDLAARARIVIVGDRPSEYSQRLHLAAKELPQARQGRVLILGETSEARAYLVGADVAVCSSRNESYPRVTLEAMAAGLPLITTGVWGIREQVRPGYNALLYEPGDIDALAAHMAEMIGDEKMRGLIASRAVPVFESLPNFEFMRDSYATLIRQAVGSR